MSASAERPRLTTEQKKANHIESERKRRVAIRDGFEKLSNIVPDSQGQARSEGVVLGNTVKHIHNLQAKKEDLRKQSAKKGMGDLRFEQHYRDAAKKARDERDGKETSTPASRPGSSRSTGAEKVSRFFS